MFAKLTNYFQGRHTFFVSICLAIGVGMSWFHKLDGNLVTLLLGLQAMVLGHSTKESFLHE
jgi:hypothetical protein